MYRFQDRRDAGRRLGEMLQPFAASPNVLVLGLPRGGIPVAYEVARALHAPLDVLIVRKIGVPGHEELAMGAIASGGVKLLNRQLIQQLHVTPSEIETVVERERIELERRELAYRDGRAPVSVRGRTVIVVDDGLATGASMSAAVAALRRQEPFAIIVAAPVGTTQTCDTMRHSADGCVCVQTPHPFHGVGEWYVDFDQTTDDEVRTLLAAARMEQGGVAHTSVSA